MPIEVSDVRSNPQDQIAHASRVLGRSDPRRNVFAAIHAGKNRAMQFPVKPHPKIEKESILVLGKD